MKKILNPKLLPLIVILCSILGLGLRFWTLGSGPDEKGLYPSQPLAWTLLWLFTAGVFALIFLTASRLKKPGSFEDNYPASIPAAVGTAIAAVSFLVGGGQLFLEKKDVLDIITALLGVASGGVLLPAAYARLKGSKPFFLFHGIPCLYLALKVFNQCQVWSNEPQIGTFVFPFLASLGVMLALYQRTCFDVGLGNRRLSVLWSLGSVYLCIIAMLSFQDQLFYGATAIWLTADLCSLRPLNKRKAPQRAAPREEAPQSPNIDIDPPSELRPEDMSIDQLKDWLEN